MKFFYAAAVLVGYFSILPCIAEQTVKCGNISFAIPAKSGDLPTVELDYPSKVTTFSFHDGNLLLIAADASDPTRVRAVISAQAVKRHIYRGQIVTDSGGNQLQIDNGPVACSVH